MNSWLIDRFQFDSSLAIEKRFGVAAFRENQLPLEGHCLRPRCRHTFAATNG